MEFLNQIILDNSIRSYLIVAVAILFILLTRKLFSKLIASLLFGLFLAAGKKIEKKSFIALIIKPLSWFIVIVVTVFFLDKLNYPDQWHYSIYGTPLQVIFQKSGVMLIIISFFRCLLSSIDFIALLLKEKGGGTKTKGDDQLIVFFRDFLKVLMVIIGILLLIKAGLNQNISTLLTGLSLVGAALALAAKESLENLIASFIIFFDKPFYVNDYLKVNNFSGRVEHIGLRSTRIRTNDKTLITVPNKQMVDSVVDNWSMRTEQRTEIQLDLSLKTESTTLLAFLGEVKSMLTNNKEILVSDGYFSDYSRNAIIIKIEYISPRTTEKSLQLLHNGINMEIKKIIEKHQIEGVVGVTRN